MVQSRKMTIKSAKIIDCQKLSAKVQDKQVLHDFSWHLPVGQVRVLLGPNGAGKSSLGRVLAGDTNYRITGGKIYYRGEDITTWSAEKRAQAGIFLSWQQPVAIPGVRVKAALRQMVSACQGKAPSLWDWNQQLVKLAQKLQLPAEFLEREFNVGFSGGESKKLEVLQLLVLQPKVVILDELDSGLDIDAVQVVRQILKAWQQETHASVLIITHTGELVQQWPVDGVEVLQAGKIVASGGQELLTRVKQSGYDWVEGHDERTDS